MLPQAAKESELEKHTKQIRRYQIGLVDSMAAFKNYLNHSCDLMIYSHIKYIFNVK